MAKIGAGWESRRVDEVYFCFSDVAHIARHVPPPA